MKKALILAGGAGSRMKQAVIEKPLMPIFGIPAIVHIVLNLKKIAVKEIIISVIENSKIIECLGTGEKYGVKIFYSKELSSNGTGAGILKAIKNFDNKPFLVVSGDVFFTFSIENLSINNNEFAHIILNKSRSKKKDGRYIFGENSKIFPANMGKDASVETFAFSGIGLFNSILFQKYSPNKTIFDLQEVIENSLMNGESIVGSDVGAEYFGDYVNLNTQDDFLLANEIEYHRQKLFSPVEKKMYKSVETCFDNSLYKSIKALKEEFNMVIENMIPIMNGVEKRIYYKIIVKNNSFIFVDSSRSTKEENVNFLKLAGVVRKSEIVVPKIFNVSKDYKFFIIEDFGDAGLLYVYKNYEHIFDVITMLSKPQKLDSASLPIYTVEIYEGMFGFISYFLELYCGISLEYENKEFLIKLFEFVAKYSTICIPQAFCHKDFQSALKVAITYDLIISFKNICTCEFDRNLFEKAINFYKNEINMHINKDNFNFWLILSKLHRHLKALGTFCLLAIKNKNTDYIKYIPNSINCLIDLCKQEKNMFPFLSKLYDILLKINFPNTDYYFYNLAVSTKYLCNPFAANNLFIISGTSSAGKSWFLKHNVPDSKGFILVNFEKIKIDIQSYLVKKILGKSYGLLYEIFGTNLLYYIKNINYLDNKFILKIYQEYSQKIISMLHSANKRMANNAVFSDSSSVKNKAMNYLLLKYFPLLKTQKIILKISNINIQDVKYFSKLSSLLVIIMHCRFSDLEKNIKFRNEKALVEKKTF
jgi:MurNAc alpha-1-phosphate uridylyltransferase